LLFGSGRAVTLLRGKRTGRNRFVSRRRVLEEDTNTNEDSDTNNSHFAFPSKGR
jgi:hypothetical protein